MATTIDRWGAAGGLPERIEPPRLDPTAERLVASLLAIFFMLFGWSTLWQVGVSLKSKSGAVSFIDGRAGFAVAGGLVLGPPLVFVELNPMPLPSRRDSSW